MSVDSLEARRLLSSLMIAGTSEADRLRLSVAGHTKTGMDVRVDNTGRTTLTVRVDDTAVKLAAGATIRTEQIVRGGVTVIGLIDLGDGDDASDSTAVPVRTTVSGGGGDDILSTGDGDDAIDGGAGRDAVFGGGGGDTINAAAAGVADDGASDTLAGGDGNDTLTGGVRTSLSGDGGDDTLTAPPPARIYGPSATLSGGEGNDRLTGYNLQGDAGNDTLVAVSGDDVARLEGGAGNDSLVGSPADDELDGGNGDDTLVGNAGNDRLYGAAGNDSMAGGTGDDGYFLYDAPPAAERDRVTEQANGGRDRLLFGEDFDGFSSFGNIATDLPVRVDLSDPARLVAQGKRTVVTAAGLQDNFEDVIGSPANDTIVGNRAANHLLGSNDGAGFVGAQPAYDADSIRGGDGADTLRGNGPDTLDGGAGDDTLETFEQADVRLGVTGGPGHDTHVADFDGVYGVGGIDRFTLAADVEDLRVQNAESVRHVVGNALGNRIDVEIDYTFLDEGSRANHGPETVSGGDGNDTIVGGVFDPTVGQITYLGQTLTFEGNGGDDLLVGASVADSEQDDVFLRGGAGRDTLQSASGVVWADYSDHTTAVAVDLSKRTYAGSGGDVDTFGTGLENVRGGSGNDTLVGDAKDNVLDGGLGRDDLSGGGGRDTVQYTQRVIGVNASLDGVANDGQPGEKDFVRADVEGLIGTPAADTLTGSAAANVLLGLAGNDVLNGGAGDDTLTGGDGGDTLNGDAGSDTAVYHPYPIETLYDYGLIDVSVTLDGKADDRDGEDYQTGKVIYDSVNTENVDGADTVVGDDGPNRLTRVRSSADGRGGDDVIIGVGRLLGGTGADYIEGSLISYAGRKRGVSVSLDGVANDGEPGERDNVVGVAGDDLQYGPPSTLVGTAFDDLLVGDDAPNVIFGGDGRDTVRGGGGVDTVAGGKGDDSIDGGDGDDLLMGGGTLAYVDVEPTSGPDGADRFAGGAGTDTLDYGGRADDLLLTLDGQANDGASGERDEIGTGDIERLDGGAGDDYFAAGSADAAFYGDAGADTFVGGTGRDTVTYTRFAFSSDGGVSVSLNDKPDDGRPGEHDDVRSSIDAVIGTDDADVLTAGDRPATLNGGYGGDLITGGPADDQLSGNRATLRGMGGNDLFVNQNGIPDTIDGGDGFDSVQDDDTDADVPGVQNDAFANVEFKYDTLAGDAADEADVPLARAAGALAPVALVPAAVVGGVSVDLDAKGVLRVVGTKTADTLEISQAGGTIAVSVGRSAAGSFKASAVKRVDVDAGAGDDTVRLATAAGKSPLQVSARVHGGDGADTIRGGAGGDVLAGEGGSDSVTGGTGNDVLGGDFVILIGEAVPAAAKLPDASDTIAGGGGSDLVSYTNRTAAVTIDMNAGSVTSGKERDKVSGVRLMVGSQTADKITGSTAGDILFGGSGDDTIDGGRGNDELRSGVGADSVLPGSGNDFIDTGPDRVRDRIVGRLDADGANPRTDAGAVLDGPFNELDYFTLSGRYYGQKR